MPVRISLALGFTLALGACQQANGGAQPDSRIAGNDIDPAVTSAINDQILVDPALTQQSNSNAVRPPDMPIQAFYPVGNGDAAAERQSEVGGTGCGTGPFKPDLAWARRLPAAFALPPGARVTEAAGHDEPGCSTRVVTFGSVAAPERLLEYYRVRAVDAGYSAAPQRREGDRILAGSNAQSGTRYYLVVTPKSGGSEVALVTTAGS